ncbi:MAG: hypothetical protein QXO70_04235 [Candidatus Pacearchaeota archaeon]
MNCEFEQYIESGNKIYVKVRFFDNFEYDIHEIQNELERVFEGVRGARLVHFIRDDNKKYSFVFEKKEKKMLLLD